MLMGKSEEAIRLRAGYKEKEEEKED